MTPASSIPPKPAIYITPSGDKAVIVIESKGHVLAEVFPSQKHEAGKLAEMAVIEYRAERGFYPAISPPEREDDFCDFIAAFSSRVCLCEQIASLIPTHLFDMEAAIIAANRGQLTNYVQAVATLGEIDPREDEAVEHLTHKILANRRSEIAAILAAKPGFTFEGRQRINIQAMMLEAANTTGISDRLPANPATVKPRGPLGDIAEQLTPWWSRFGAALMQGEDGLPTSPEAVRALCPGMTSEAGYQAAEALRTLKRASAAVQKIPLEPDGVRPLLPDIVGYQDQWKLLAALALSTSYKQGMVSAIEHSSPLAYTLRKLHASRVEALPLMGPPDRSRGRRFSL